VNNVICCARQGHTKAQILEEDYPDLTEAQVEAAFAYYREFPREIDAELARDECGEPALRSEQGRNAAVAGGAGCCSRLRRVDGPGARIERGLKQTAM
jgi:hypothetical protein